MRRHGKVDKNQSQLVAAMRKMGWKVISLAPLGHGIPDLLAKPPGRPLVLLEVKDPSQPLSKQKLTPEQAVFHSEWPVAVVRSIDDLLKL